MGEKRKVKIQTENEAPKERGVLPGGSASLPVRNNGHFNKAPLDPALKGGGSDVRQGFAAGEQSGQHAEIESESLPEGDADQEGRVKPDSLLAELKTQLESSQKEARENYDRLLRVSADFENYKKRSARELDDFRRFANESLIKVLLPVIDNLERALDSASNSQHSNSLVKGVQLTLSEVFKVFEKFNVKQIESLEKPFDPGFHQAVMQQEADTCPDKTILKELQKGYLMHDKLIRPAMVVVSRKKEMPESQGNNIQLETTKKEMIISDSEEDTANG